MDDSTAVLAPPFSAADVAGFVLTSIAVIYGFIWMRDREPGLGWCAFGAAFLGLWMITDAHSVSVDGYMRRTFWHFPLVLGLGGMGWGLLRYFDPPPRQRWLGVLGAIAPIAIIALVLSWSIGTGARVALLIPQGLIAVYCFVLAILAFQAARREPHCGHAAVGVALLAIPMLLVALRLAGMPPDLLRYVGILPYIALCLTVLAVSLRRRRVTLQAEVEQRRSAQAALVKANESLEHRVAERTEDLNAVIAGLESFNRAVSHDLRGPLGGIAELARMAAQELRAGNPEPALRYLPLISQQADRSMRLVAALMELARSDNAPLHTEPVTLQAVALDTARALRRPDAEPAISIELGHLPPVPGDPALVGAIFTNLVGNAHKFCPAGAEARIALTGSIDDEFVTVHIKDNGVGFDSSTATRLFKPFGRLHGAQFEGHGIGLCIVRRAVERHGGRVWADSRPGAGATFSFTLRR